MNEWIDDHSHRGNLNLSVSFVDFPRLLDCLLAWLDRWICLDLAISKEENQNQSLILEFRSTRPETKAFLWVWARPMIQRMVSERLYFRLWPISILSRIMIILLFSRSNQTSINHQSVSLTVNDHGIYYNNRITFERSFITRQHALGNHSSIAFRNISRPRVETRSFGRFVGHDSGIGLFIETRTH